MDTCEDRPYMPRLNTTYRSNFKELKPTQSLSRDKHNKIRAMRHQFTKRKSDCVELFTNKPLFVFKLLKDKIQIADPLLKQTINYLLEKYENITSSIINCKTEIELVEKCTSLQKMCDKIENTINKTKFIEYMALGYFADGSGTDIRENPAYKDYIVVLEIEVLNEKEDVEAKLKQSEVRKNISFADMLKRNIN